MRVNKRVAVATDVQQIVVEVLATMRSEKAVMKMLSSTNARLRASLARSTAALDDSFGDLTTQPAGLGTHVELRGTNRRLGRTLR